MKILRIFSLCALTTAVAVPATADVNAQTRQLLIEALTANARGECPREILSDYLKIHREEQVASLKSRFTALGPIRGAELTETKQTPSGPAGIYLVHFANGTWTWIANTNAEGKLFALGTNKEPDYATTG